MTHTRGDYCHLSPQASRLRTMLSCDSEDRTVPAPSTVQAWKGTVVQQWEGMVRKVVEKKLLLSLPLLQQETKTSAGNSQCICEGWNGKSSTFHLGEELCFRELPLFQAGGNATKHGILEKNVIDLLLNNSARILKYWSKAVLKERVFWHFYFDNWAAWEPDAVCSFSKMPIIL